MLQFLLQVVEASDTTQNTQATKEVEITLFDLILKGGWAMIPLALLLGLGIYIFIERYLIIKKSDQSPEQFMKQVRELVRSGDIKRAAMLCDATDSPYARMIGKGIRRLGSPLPDIMASIENEGKLEINRLEKSLGLLATVAGAAPMIGFLGTVTGLIAAFMNISQYEGNVNPSLLSGGIYEAMITTAAGLFVGIPTYFGYNYLTMKIANLVAKMEITSTEFIDLLQEPIA
ncbi:MAG: MotA/TolQ/ExbB proton channel family protein [Bacteroidia bacterium]|nr:MotA/TolQ/ExbB proton channel family protein [Bacteroidia bacterium]MDW8159615.1 MotA/TolQ/ExbB proton channel family protein [Bacteroidia bacterium]